MAKTYIDWSSCKARSGEFGEFFNLSFQIDKLKEYANEKGYVNMVMSKRKEEWQYWDTHYFTLNEWTPEWKTDTKSESKQNDGLEVEDIPF